MDYRIIRGKNKIGGTITEIESLSGTKIWVDFGAELSVSPEKSTDSFMIEGINKDHPEAVIFTHIHGDHIGLLYAIPSDIDIYMGELARELLINIRETLVKVDDMDQEEKEKITIELRMLKSKQVKLYQDRISQVIGDISFTPYKVDHSVADAYMLRFDADNRSIVHTGDFRNHGRLGKNLIDDIKNGIASCPVDVLIIEGTMMSRKGEKCKTEMELEKEAADLLVKNKYAFLICSSTNMESLASFYWATINAGKIRSRTDKKDYKPALICNSYIKKQLDLFTKKVGDFEDWRFQFHRSYRISDNLNYVFGGKSQKQRMIDDGFTMIVGTSDYYRELMREFKYLEPKPVVIYSMWDGYVRENMPYSNEELIDLKKEWSDVFKPMHTSGHASIETLTNVIKAINPTEKIVPIHTENPKGFFEMKLPKELLRKMEIDQINDVRGLRNADNLLHEIETIYPKEYGYLVDKVNEKDENGVYKFYLGIRNNSVILYYLGSKVGEIYINGKGKKRKIHFDIDKYYIGKEKDNFPNFDEYKKALDDPSIIIKKANEYAYGRRKDVDESRQRKHYEKICQQWIINNNNSDPKSKWFYSDMEYTDGVLPKQKRFGRFDLIAIGKEKTKGKYPIALIELKVGSGAFRGGKATSKDKEKKADIEAAYDKLRNNLYTNPENLYPVSFGSGLVSHVADFLRYLNYREELYIQRLKKEIINSIRVHKKLGVLDEKWFRDINEDELTDNPEVYFAMYTMLPKELRKEGQPINLVQLQELKRLCYHYLYKSKGYCIKDSFGNQLNNSFTKDENMDKLKAIISCDDRNRIDMTQPLKDNEYDFNFVFIDPDNENKAWDFLG